jgi:D-alanine-D-alanine ligase
VASTRLSVAVVQGGPSTEAEVSRASAAGVATALAEAGHRPVRLEVDAFLAESLRTGGFDVVFPVVHGAVGEDGSLQGLLEVLELPYVGSGVLASALAMHKRMARVVFGHAGLPVARGLALPRPKDLERDRAASVGAAAENARRQLGGAIVVKPSSHGSAIGVTRLEADAAVEDVVRALESVWELDDFAIVEQFARGEEVTCGVLETDDASGAVALPPTAILTPNDPFYTYTARYAPGRSVHVCPAKLSLPVFARVQEVAVAAHVALGCRDLSRVDFIVGADGTGSQPSEPEKATVTLLEVNTLPGMTATSLYPEAAAVGGMPMPRLCDALVQRAHARGPTTRLPPRALPR